jgi:hypothetical protein
MKNTSKNKYGVYFGLVVNRAGYFKVFSRWGVTHLPEWQREVPVIGSDCVNGNECAAVIDEMIRDLERLKKWAVRYGESEEYGRKQTAAWTGRAGTSNDGAGRARDSAQNRRTHDSRGGNVN